VQEVGVVIGFDAEQGFLLQPQNDVPLQRIVALLDRISAAGGKNVILVRE
jgi:biopolymer transport protein ExbD